MPLLVALARRARPAVVLGLVTGGVYFAGTLYWITSVMRQYGGLSTPIAVVLNGALVAYLALFPGLFAAVQGRLVARLGWQAMLGAPFVWVATELARAHVCSGFPWALLGTSQMQALPVAQVASLAGVYGVGMLVVLVNVGLTCLVVGRGAWRVAPGVVAIVALGIALPWGSARVRDGRLTREGAAITVGLVQGNIAQEDKWDPAKADRIMAAYLEMTRAAAGRGARFVIWPESATPFYYEESVEAERVRQVARETGAHLLLGSDQIERGSPARYYNSAFLVAPDGGTRAVYRKIHLVPFGEYVPMSQLLTFAAPLVESVSNFSPGDRHVLLPVGDRVASTAICYEVVYPDLVRRFVVAGSELLTTITNDAWYGDSSAPYQHFEQAAMRAIEQGRYLARAANTGISGIVDPYGRIVVKSGMFEPAVLTGEVRFLTGRTVYGRTGDWLAYVCAAFTVAALLATMREQKGRNRGLGAGGR